MDTICAIYKKDLQAYQALPEVDMVDDILELSEFMKDGVRWRCDE